MSAVQVIKDLEALGVVLRFNSYKVDLTVPDKATHTTAIQRLQAAMSVGEYQSMVELIQTRDAFTWNIPPDPCEGPACQRFKDLAHLRAVCLVEGFALSRMGKDFIVLAEPPYSPDTLAAMDYTLTILEPLKADLLAHAEHFPELHGHRARGLLNQIQAAHRGEGFQVRGWQGLTFPYHWPERVLLAVQTLYTQSLQDQGATPKE